MRSPPTLETERLRLRGWERRDLGYGQWALERREDGEPLGRAGFWNPPGTRPGGLAWPGVDPEGTGGGDLWNRAALRRSGRR